MKTLALIGAVAISSLAGEIPCEDLLRYADNTGVRVMGKTFDSIMEGNWVCHEEDNRYIAVAKTEHHILTIEGSASVDFYVERLSVGEREVAVKTESGKSSVQFLPFGKIEELQVPYL